jgi:hypothetical protein
VDESSAWERRAGGARALDRAEEGGDRVRRSGLTIDLTADSPPLPSTKLRARSASCVAHEEKNGRDAKRRARDGRGVQMGDVVKVIEDDDDRPASVLSGPSPSRGFVGNKEHEDEVVNVMTERVASRAAQRDRARSADLDSSCVMIMEKSPAKVRGAGARSRRDGVGESSQAGASMGNRSGTGHGDRHKSPDASANSEGRSKRAEGKEPANMFAEGNTAQEARKGDQLKISSTVSRVFTCPVCFDDTEKGGYHQPPAAAPRPPPFLFSRMLVSVGVYFTAHVRVKSSASVIR